MVTESLYEMLGVTKEAQMEDLKKAYYKKALQVHPDKQSPNATDVEKEQAKALFQNLSLAYSVLSDEKQRKIYDLTGTLPSEDNLTQKTRDWELYWRELFPKITTQDIETFEKQYKGKKLTLRGMSCFSDP
jgi:DnaJ family protein C protein 9